MARRMTDPDREVLPRVRRELIRVAEDRTTLTYGELVARADLPHAPRTVGRLLELISAECHYRGEPTLAALVINKDTGEVGESFRGDPHLSRAMAWSFFSRRTNQ